MSHTLAKDPLYNPPQMLLKIALLMWFGALFMSLVAKGEKRSWMARLFVGGFCLLLLAMFLKIISRII